MTEDEIQDRLRCACVELRAPGGDVGTGYVIAVDRIATANHVVRSWADGGWYDVSVGWGSKYRHNAEARVLRRDVTSDAAILELRNSRTAIPLPVLNASARNGSHWWGFGFPTAIEREGVLTGVPTGGTVVDAGWSNARQVSLLLLRSHEAATGRPTPLAGYSGTPVTVNGALVGHIVEQFDDPDDINRPILGFVKACPASAIVDLLAQDARSPDFASDASQRENAQEDKRPRDLDLAEAFAWCDREAVKDCIEDWVLHSQRPAAGLLCIVGASSYRPSLLLTRVAEEIQSVYGFNRLRVVHFKDRLDLTKPGEMEKRLLKALGIEKSDQILHAAEFRRGASSLVLCLSLETAKWSEADAKRALKEISAWLALLPVHARKFMLVVNLRYERPTLLDRFLSRERPSIHQVLADAYQAVIKDSATSLAQVAVSDSSGLPLELGKYSQENVRLLQEVPRVKDVLKGLLDEDFFEWFGNRGRSYPEIEKYLKDKYPYLRNTRGS